MADVPQPVTEASRIESLDLLRGFALLGILLLNIIGFALPHAAYSNPGLDLVGGSSLDLWVYAAVELFGEGAMRCLFSILFGAGVVLFTTGANVGRGALHYKRTAWLLVLGLVDAYVLLWNGDILVTYAIAGFVLYPLRNLAGRTLLVTALVLIALMALFYLGLGYALREAHLAYQTVAAAADPASVSADVREGAAFWVDFVGDFQPTAEAVQRELAARRASYASAFFWNVPVSNEMIFFVVPVILFWDALAMMMLGMALYRLGVLQGDRPTAFYVKLMVAGFVVGLAVNAFEVSRAIGSQFDVFQTFAQMQPTYHFGRLGMACGYIGLLLVLSHRGAWPGPRRRLASVGRMALTNYLMHSLICLFVFTGAGLALVGELSRAGIYVVVLAIWALQLMASPWWLRRYRYGPVEWLWRSLTYGRRQAFRRV